MRIILIIIAALLLSNCTSSYVKNKKIITSPNDLQKFTNVWCEKSKTTDKKILMCGSAWSKDLGISESKAIMSAKLKIADVTSHTMVRSEKVMHKENNKGVVKSYEMNADNQLIDVTISGYRVLHKKILKEKNGWRTMVVLEYKLT